MVWYDSFVKLSVFKSDDLSPHFKEERQRNVKWAIFTFFIHPAKFP